MDQGNIVMIAEQGNHLLALTATHQTCIHIDTSQLIADGFMD